MLRFASDLLIAVLLTDKASIGTSPDAGIIVEDELTRLFLSSVLPSIQYHGNLYGKVTPELEPDRKSNLPDNVSSGWLSVGCGKNTSS